MQGNVIFTRPCGVSGQNSSGGTQVCLKRRNKKCQGRVWRKGLGKPMQEDFG